MWCNLAGFYAYSFKKELVMLLWQQCPAACAVSYSSQMVTLGLYQQVQLLVTRKVSVLANNYSGYSFLFSDDWVFCSHYHFFLFLLAQNSYCNMSPTKAINRRCGRPPRRRTLRPWIIFNLVQKHCKDIIIILSENPRSVEEIPFFLSFFLVNRELFWQLV